MLREDSILSLMVIGLVRRLHRATYVYHARGSQPPSSYTGLVIKQADVILMGFPWEFQHTNITAQTRANDLNVYSLVTDPGGPAMTWVRG